MQARSAAGRAIVAEVETGVAPPKSYERTIKIRKATIETRIGVRFGLHPETKQVIITELYSGYPAHDCGNLFVGDVVTKINKVLVTDVDMASQLVKMTEGEVELKTARPHRRRSPDALVDFHAARTSAQSPPQNIQGGRPATLYSLGRPQHRSRRSRPHSSRRRASSSAFIASISKRSWRSCEASGAKTHTRTSASPRPRAGAAAAACAHRIGLGPLFPLAALDLGASLHVLLDLRHGCRL